jgi:NAD(P)-dependent dehydrogenase (short-subunit alcohol dehydrogenase family)
MARRGYALALLARSDDGNALATDLGAVAVAGSVTAEQDLRTQVEEALARYGRIDAVATVNAPRLKPEVLQRLMRHKSYQTTQKHYINPTSQMQDAASDMPVPDALKKDQTNPTEGKKDGEEKRAE